MYMAQILCNRGSSSSDGFSRSTALPEAALLRKTCITSRATGVNAPPAAAAPRTSQPPKPHVARRRVSSRKRRANPGVRGGGAVPRRFAPSPHNTRESALRRQVLNNASGRGNFVHASAATASEQPKAVNANAGWHRTLTRKTPRALQGPRCFSPVRRTPLRYQTAASAPPSAQPGWR
jgi:hypothetical protein